MASSQNAAFTERCSAAADQSRVLLWFKKIPSLGSDLSHWLFHICLSDCVRELLELFKTMSCSCAEERHGNVGLTRLKSTLHSLGVRGCEGMDIEQQQCLVLALMPFLDFFSPAT